MTTENQKTSRLLAAVHETARDLHAAGCISKRRMEDYDTLCLGPVHRRARSAARSGMAEGTSEKARASCADKR